MLSLEFSSDHREVAAWNGGAQGSPADWGLAVCGPGEVTRPVALVEEALQLAGLLRAEVQRLAIGLGPGSHTGIRMALAFAQGWQLARPVDVVGIPTPLCLAHQLQEAGFRGPLRILIDAQRGEYGMDHFHIGDTSVTVVEPSQVVGAEEVHGWIKEDICVAGPGLTGRFPEVKTLWPSAKMLGRLALHATPACSAADLVPVYLRPAQFVKAPAPRKL